MVPAKPSRRRRMSGCTNEAPDFKPEGDGLSDRQDEARSDHGSRDNGYTAVGSGVPAIAGILV